MPPARSTNVVSLKSGSIQGMNHDKPGDKIHVDAVLDSTSADDFDALLLPGGVANPDKLRTDENAVNFVRAFFDSGKPVAAICHGPWLLVEADVVEGRNVTSWPSLHTDLENAGANWSDDEVVDGSRTRHQPQARRHPCIQQKMIEEFAEGVHEEQRASVHASAAH